MGSRGSVIPLFLSCREKGFFPITDNRMTRFMIDLEEGVKLVWDALSDMIGGEIYIKKISSMKITDIASAIDPNIEQRLIGIRPGEKLHEQMIGIEDAPFTFEYQDYFKILPSINEWYKDPLRIGKGKLVNQDFYYNSESNKDWMSIQQLRIWLKKNFKI